jgi:hypothetical protein
MYKKMMMIFYYVCNNLIFKNNYNKSINKNLYSLIQNNKKLNNKNDKLK